MLHKDLLAKRFVILLILLWIVLSQCGASNPSKKPKKLEKSKEIVSHNIFDTSYFPKNIFSKNITNWYSEILKGMNEPVLYTITDKKIEIYRFTLIPSFRQIMSIRVYQSGEKSFFMVKEFGVERDNIKRQLHKKEWQNILTHVKTSSFWSLKSNIDDAGNDGARFIIEGVKNGKYHVVDRWMPDKGNYREFCNYLLTISEVD